MRRRPSLLFLRFMQRTDGAVSEHYIIFIVLMECMYTLYIARLSRQVSVREASEEKNQHDHSQESEMWLSLSPTRSSTSFLASLNKGLASHL